MYTRHYSSQHAGRQADSWLLAQRGLALPRSALREPCELDRRAVDAGLRYLIRKGAVRALEKPPPGKGPKRYLATHGEVPAEAMPSAKTSSAPLTTKDTKSASPPVNPFVPLLRAWGIALVPPKLPVAPKKYMYGACEVTLPGA